MEKSEITKKAIFTLRWSVNIEFYIFTSDNIYIIFHQYFPVFHYFVYNKAGLATNHNSFQEIMSGNSILVNI